MIKRTLYLFAACVAAAALCSTAAYADGIKNMNIDTFDRKTEQITESTEKTEYQKGQSYIYNGLGGIFGGIYYNENNSSFLSQGDYAEITKSDYDGDRCLHIHADAYSEDTNKYIELYKAPEIALDAEYNFIYEGDILFADNICGISFAIKAGGAWRNIEFNIPKGSRILDSRGDKQALGTNEWHHLAIVLHKDSAVFSFYIDGSPLFERKELKPAPTQNQKPGRLSSLTLKIAKGAEPSDVYLDNIRWYEQYEDYDYTVSSANVTSKRYKLSNGEIYNVPRTTAKDFLSNISVNNGAVAEVTESERQTRVRDEHHIHDGMYLSVTAADGLSRRFYRIHTEERVKFYNQSGEQIKCVYENESVTATAENDTAARLIMALYNDGGTLIGAKLFENGKCTVSGIDKAENSYIKVYNWNNMQPQDGVQILNSRQHPFMLVTRDDFSTMQAKASQSPWKEIKRNAASEMRAEIGSEKVNTDDSYANKCNKISNKLSAAMLTYIIDPSLRKESREILLDTIGFWNEDREGNIYEHLYNQKGDYFSRCVPPATALVYSILALDILHDDISADELSNAEKLLSAPAQRYIDTDEGHMAAVLGVRGIWGIYTGNEQLVNSAWNEWLATYNSYLSNDGVGSMGTEYATVRFVSNERMAKAILPLVMEHTGRTEGFFDTEKYTDFAEWAIGYTYAPGRQSWTIGDTSARRKVNENTQMAFKASMFSKDAAAMRSYIFNNTHSGTLMNYLTAENVEKKTPESRVFKEGGAWFYEDLNNRASLGGFMLNTTKSDGHTHKETNAVNIAAYGEVLTINSGYNKYGQGVNGYSWQYINMHAISANTVLVDYNYDNIQDPTFTNDHRLKTGAGIASSMITDKISYALGDSGEALPNAVHERGFMMVSPEEDIPGYFILADKVDSGTEMTVVHRPFSDVYSEISSKKEYTWTINRDSGHNVGLSVYLAAKPTSAEIVDGVTAVWESGYPLKTLMAKYPADKRALTVLYPYDGTHPKAAISRITGSAEGAVITSGSTTDYLVQNGNFAKSGAEYLGDLILVRKKDGVLSWFFAENATSFSYDGKQYFTSDNGISVFMNGKNEDLFSASARYDSVVTVNADNISSVYVNGTKQTIWDNDGTKATFLLPEGENTVEIRHKI